MTYFTSYGTIAYIDLFLSWVENEKIITFTDRKEGNSKLLFLPILMPNLQQSSSCLLVVFFFPASKAIREVANLI